MSSLNELLAELCKGIDECEASTIMTDRCLTVDDMAVSLHPAGEFDAEGLHAYCELGPLPDGPAGVDALKRLLEFNLFLFRRDAPSFGLDSKGGHAVLMLRLSLPTLTAEVLMQSLGSLADLARRWQQTHFADGSLGADDAFGMPADSLASSQTVGVA